MSGRTPLPGVEKDYEELVKTFREPFFDTVIAKNETKEKIEKKIEKAAELASQYKYKSVFIAFSGHGNKEKKEPFIMSDDGKKIWVKEFVNLVVTRFDKEVPKIFLLDSCRGSIELKPKRKGEGNYLIAYSTEDNYEALMRNNDGGSYWMPIVARHLRKVDDTVVNVIRQANKHLQEDLHLEYNQHAVLDDDNFSSIDLNIYQGTYMCYV